MRNISLLDNLRSMCRKSFYMFVKEMWSTIIPEKPVWNWHIKYLCDELQIVAERVFKGLPKEHDLVINIAPGSTKSVVVSVMFPVWVWLKFPTARSICGSYSFQLAMDLSRRSRDIVRSDVFQHYFPDVALRDDQNAKGYFINTKGGSRYSFGFDGTVTGIHAHFIIVDDPINPKQAASEAELKTANDCMSETLSQRKIDKEVSVIIVIAQRLHQNDPSGNKLIKGGSKHICIPAEETDDIKPSELRKFYVNGLFDPVRFPRSVLDEAKKDLGEFGYAGQMLQKPVPRSGGLFKTDRITRHPNNNLPNFLVVVRSWDNAGSKDSGAYTAGVKVGLERLPNNRIRPWVLHSIRGQWDSGKRETVKEQIAEMDGKSVIIGQEQEPGSGGKESAESTVARLVGYKVVVDRVSGSKESRADPLSVQVNNGNLVMVEGEWNQEWLDEGSHWPFSRYKDQWDATAGAFNTAIKQWEEIRKKEKEKERLEGELLTNNIPKQHLEKIKREKQNRQQEADTKEVETKILTSRGEVEIDWDQER